jgi:DHA1 family multidrug resistance protein-like MFS transporter
MMPVELAPSLQGTANRNVLSISFSQFCATVSFNFIYIFLPFYISRSSPYGPRGTLLWTGAIMGSSALCLALTAPTFGSLAHRFRPRSIYLGGLLFNVITVLLMAFTQNMLLLFILRVFQGVGGGISTIGLIITAVSSTVENRAYHLGIFQSCMAAGQLLGPFLGTFAVTAFGYQGAFVSASIVLFISVVWCYVAVTDIPALPPNEEGSVRSLLDKRVIAGWTLCVAATIHLMFAPGILPNIFQHYGLAHDFALRWAGALVMLYTATAMIGTYVWSRLSRRVGVRRMILLLAHFAIALQLLLVLAGGMTFFTAILMLLTGMAAAIMPLTMSLLATGQKGSIIGFLNSARFVGNALGPMLATSVLAFSGLPVLYVLISTITLFSLFGFKRFL